MSAENESVERTKRHARRIVLAIRECERRSIADYDLIPRAVARDEINWANEAVRLTLALPINRREPRIAGDATHRRARSPN